MDPERSLLARDIGATSAPVAARVALVTGGSSGIGAACVRTLLLDGFAVVAVARSQERIRRAHAALDEAQRARLLPLAADLSHPGAPQLVAQTALRAFGAVDVLVNSIGSTRGGSLLELDDDAWMDGFRGKVLAAVGLMRQLVPAMRQRRFGRVISIAGTAGREPDAWMGLAGAMNAALTVASKALSREVAADGVTVNVVAPGPTRTPRWSRLIAARAAANSVDEEVIEEDLLLSIPAGHPAEPEDIAALVSFLASARAGHLTGESIAVDGGEMKSW